MKIDSVLLVEDSEITINYNKRLIKRSGLSDNVKTALNGEDAIEYILNVKDDSVPKLILLDLNMPILGGFGFLTKYQELISEERRKDIVVVLLTTSIFDRDLIKSKEYAFVPLFLTKPLTYEKLKAIADEHFTDECKS